MSSLDDLIMHDSFYWDLFKGLDVGEISWLLSDDPLNSVFIYDHAGKSVERADFGLPWPVLFLLGFRHKKHRFCGNKIPDIRDFVQCTAEAIDKIKWRAFFKDTAPRPCHRQLLYPRRVAPFSATIDPAVNDFCHQLSCCILDSFGASVSRAKGLRTRSSNTLPIELAARDWIACSPWVPMPSDKDGGFTLVHESVIRDIQRDLLAGPWYRVFGTNCLEQTWRSLVPQYRRIAASIADVDSRTSRHVLCASLGEGASRMPSYLIHTCKTHKDAGEVGFRPVHASSRHAFTGIMCWISLILSDVLKRWKHLVHSSDDFIERITQVPCDDNDVFMHIDLKDFFMTGSTTFLVHHVSLLVPFKFRATFRVALQFILENQFVTSNLFQGEYWRVQSGSGMGLKSSSHISNAAFLHAIELCGLSLLSQASGARFGIKSYTRYFDNILFVLKPDFERIRSLKRHLEDNIVPYKGKLEEASHIGITFLDVNIVKDESWRRTGVISFFPYLKPTCLRQALSLRSMHNPSTHGAWMKAFLQRIRKHSSCLTWYRTTKNHVLFRLRKAGIDQAIVTSIDKSSTFTFPVDLPSCLCPVRCTRPTSSLWLRLPFHPIWFSHINRSLGQFCNDPEHRQLLAQFVDSNVMSIKAAWMLRMPTLANIVRKF